MSGMVIDELITLLGVEVDPQMQERVQKFGKVIDGVTNYAKWAGAALIGAATSIAYFAEKASAASNELDKLKRLTGLNTTTFQSLGIAAEMVGGNFDNILGDLKNLTKNMSSPIPGEFNHTLFMLGINTKKANGELKTADDIFFDIADKMEGMSKQEQLQWASKLGMSEDTLLLWQEGSDRIRVLMKQAKEFPLILTDEQLEAAREYTIQIKMASRVLSYLGQVMTATITPAINSIVKGSSSWINNNKELISQKLENFINGLANGFERFFTMLMRTKDSVFAYLPIADKLLQSLTDTKTISAAVMSVLSVLTIIFVVLAAKAILIGAAIAGAALAFEDFLTYLEGGGSITGEFIDKISEMYDAFKEKFPALEELLRGFASVLKGVVAVAFDAVVNSVKLLFEGLKMMGGAIEWILEKTEQGLSKIGFGKGEGMAELTEKAMADMRAAASEFGGDLVMDAKQFNKLAVSPAPQQAGAAQSKNITVHNNFDIKGENAMGIASETSRKIDMTIQQTSFGALSPVTN